MQAVLMIPTVLTMMFGGGFLLNEWSHGALSQGMGNGHHHMLDADGLHCVSHDDPVHGSHHLAHMHGNETRPHDHCPGGSSMHHSDSMSHMQGHDP